MIKFSVPPVVEPFSFAKSLHRGQRYNIMCTVVHGDLPVSIRWFKDGRLLLDQQQQQQQSPTGSGEYESGGLPLMLGAAEENHAISSQSGLDLGIVVKHLDPYSSTLTFASLQSHHRGQYTCEASNEAGRANQSSALVIHGKFKI